MEMSLSRPREAVFSAPVVTGLVPEEACAVGIYAEYLDAGLGADIVRLMAERKKQLQRIGEIRKRDVLVYAVDVSKGRNPININYQDLLPFKDQLSNLSGAAIDLILETPGGSGETAEDLVKMLRGKYSAVGVIVPGMAKSAGTLIAMAADEILMDKSSAVGPIDAQISWQGKTFSAHALLEGMDKIKDEVTRTGSLNRAYVPILQNISPGELQHAQHALDFARDLVTDWLATYKFKDWADSVTGKPVSTERKKQRAKEIAEQLRDHGRWKTHGRSIRIDELRAMKLRVTDYSDSPDLNDAVTRYFTLLQMAFAGNLYKIFETPISQILKMEIVQVPAGNPLIPGAAFPGAPLPVAQNAGSVEVQIKCGRCGTGFVIQGRVDKRVPKNPAAIQFPDDNLVACPGVNCPEKHDLAPLRAQIESQLKRPVLKA
jgi:hypothetical protein